MKKSPAQVIRDVLHRPITPRAGSLALMLGTFGVIAYSLGSLLLPRTGWSATLLNQRVHFALVEPNQTFNGRFRSVANANPCLIEIALNTEVMEQTGSAAYFAYVTAHELGHCFDARILNNSHAGLTPTRTYTDMYKNPDVAAAETYADAYALRYLQSCNTNLSPLGWPGRSAPCELPDPHSITQADTLTDPLELIYALTQNQDHQTYPDALLDFRSTP